MCIRDSFEVFIPLIIRVIQAYVHVYAPCDLKQATYLFVVRDSDIKYQVGMLLLVVAFRTHPGCCIVSCLWSALLSHHVFIWSLLYWTKRFPPSLPVRLFFCSLTMYRACSQSDLHRISPVVYRSNVCICANKYPAYPTSTMFILVLLFVRWVFIPFVVSHQPYIITKSVMPCV